MIKNKVIFTCVLEKEPFLKSWRHRVDDFIEHEDCYQFAIEDEGFILPFKKDINKPNMNSGTSFTISMFEQFVGNFKRYYKRIYPDGKEAESEYEKDRQKKLHAKNRW